MKQNLKSQSTLSISCPFKLSTLKLYLKSKQLVTALLFNRIQRSQMLTLLFNSGRHCWLCSVKQLHKKKKPKPKLLVAYHRKLT